MLTLSDLNATTIFHIPEFTVTANDINGALDMTGLLGPAVFFIAFILPLIFMFSCVSSARTNNTPYEKFTEHQGKYDGPAMTEINRARDLAAVKKPKAHPKPEDVIALFPVKLQPEAAAYAYTAHSFNHTFNYKSIMECIAAGKYISAEPMVKNVNYTPGFCGCYRA